jgi:hypothetical protein
LEPISAALQDGQVEWVQLASYIFRVSGRSASDPLTEIVLSVNGAPMQPTHYFRTYRPELAEPFQGFGIEYALPPGDSNLALWVNGRSDYTTFLAVPEDPIRRRRHTSETALHRNDVYLTTHDVFSLAADLGLSTTSTDDQFLAFLEAQRCDGPILDFGCGGGGIIKALRSRNWDVYGLDVHAMGPFIDSAVRDRVTLYDGQFPSAFSSGAFRTVVCNQTLEHIPAYRSALEELARLTCDRLILSVPDHNVLQVCYPFGFIPLHYLIGDHCNFFNQASLTAALHGLFRTVEITRLWMTKIEGLPVHIVLVADCHK